MNETITQEIMAYIRPDTVPPAIPVVRSEELCERLMLDTDLPVPFDERLRQCLWWSGLGLVVGVFVALYSMPDLLMIYVPTLMVWLATAIFTKGFRAGHIGWHWAGGGVAVVGSVNVVVLAGFVVFFVALAVLGVALVFLVLAGLTAGS